MSLSNLRAKLLLLDEPTNALSVKESQQVMTFERNLRDEAISSVFVSHNLHHVYSIAERFIILSHGEKVGGFEKKDITIEKLEHMIVTGHAEVS